MFMYKQIDYCFIYCLAIYISHGRPNISINCISIDITCNHISAVSFIDTFILTRDTYTIFTMFTYLVMCDVHVENKTLCFDDFTKNIYYI